MDARLREVHKMGFSQAVVPRGTRKSTGIPSELELVEVNSLDEWIDLILGG
jgi:predicted ATP-dependent serine protease